MPLAEITSTEDPRIAWYRDLPRNKIPRASGLFLVEGRWMLERLIDSRYEVASVLTERGQCGELLARRPAETPAFQAERAVLSGSVGNAGGASVVFLNDSNQTNCTALGATALVLGPNCGDPLSRRAVRVSMGNALFLPIIEADPLRPSLELLRDTFGYELAATVLDPAAEPLPSARRPPRLALLFGGEGFGLEPRELARCPRKLTLPMARGADSLNLAASVGVFLYHFQCVAELERA